MSNLVAKGSLVRPGEGRTVESTKGASRPRTECVRSSSVCVVSSVECRFAADYRRVFVKTACIECRDVNTKHAMRSIALISMREAVIGY
jgi:hypothetical protein